MTFLPIPQALHSRPYLTGDRIEARADGELRGISQMAPSWRTFTFPAVRRLKLYSVFGDRQVQAGSQAVYRDTGPVYEKERVRLGLGGTAATSGFFSISDTHRRPGCVRIVCSRSEKYRHFSKRKRDSRRRPGLWPPLSTPSRDYI